MINLSLFYLRTIPPPPPDDPRRLDAGEGVSSIGLQLDFKDHDSLTYLI